MRNKLCNSALTFVESRCCKALERKLMVTVKCLIAVLEIFYMQITERPEMSSKIANPLTRRKVLNSTILITFILHCAAQRSLTYKKTVTVTAGMKLTLTW